ncbi:hypothetical protein MSAN_02520300 [Mycena sanguinolenta]|uniref:F-box domain-containing protein n=1 Tax=Mycena sanguinolenta TaxID=230812 RepID=A0A8H6TXA6_9AGAR|nr:hypothetical protein MSAN_02520300 [Mycena sanguinolenta]
MDLKDRFPNELWLEVFARLPPAARRSLSSTHRLFYDLARPLGFIEFTFYSYPYGFRPVKAQLDDALERLHFWTSPRIAPHVRLCTMSQKMHLWQTLMPSRADDENALMSAFFERLPHLNGLGRLSVNEVRFTQAGIVNLCKLPALTHVEFLRCTVATQEPIDPSATLRVSSFTTRYDYYTNDFWIPLLSRDTLQELNLYNYLGFAKSDVQPFPNVHTLKMDDFPLMVHDTVAIFSKFPNLHIFLSTYRGVLRGLTTVEESTIFPVLRNYTGPYQNLHIFVQRPTLTHITLDADYDGFPFSDFVTELQGIVALPNIVSLGVRFAISAQAAFGKTEIDTLFTLFPNLVELQLTLVAMDEGDGFTPQATSFLKMFASNPLLPGTLQSLSLEWDFFSFQYASDDFPMSTDPAAPDHADTLDFAVLRAELMTKCPALTYIFLDGYYFLFLWWKTSSRSVWEASAHTFNDADVIRAQKMKWEKSIG